MTAARGLSPHDAERLLTKWAANSDGRDGLVLAAFRAGVSKHRIHLLTGIARTTLDRILTEENLMNTASAVKSPQQENLRQRAISALLDSGLTTRDAAVYPGTDPVVIIQLAATGTHNDRTAAAAKLIASFRHDGLTLRQEPSGLTADETYLATGASAEVHELT